MPPIIWVLIVGIAAAALGTGFLGSTFSLNLQQLGVGEEDLVSPITTASIDFTISKEFVTGPGNTSPLFKNRIIKCSFHTPTTLPVGTTIICKLINADDDVIAEGKVILTTTLMGSTPDFNISIDQIAFEAANSLQEVLDVKIVVLAPKPAPFTNP